MTVYRDASGRSLEDYPRPSVAVDTAVLTIDGERRLSVLLVQGADPERPPMWRLPGTFLHPGETLSDAVVRSLRDKAGSTGLRPQQLHVFDDPRRDDRGWVLSIAHLDVVPAARIPSRAGNRIVPVTEIPDLPFDHNAIIACAVDDLRRRYESSPDPCVLVDSAEADGSFTLRDLRLVHEAVAGHPLLPDTFRRTMSGSLEDVGRLSQGRRGKPAALFRRRDSE